MKVLVTGGCGFIGSCFIKLLLRETNHNVLNIDSLTYAGDVARLTEVSSDDLYEFIRCDIGDETRIDAIMRYHKIDGIVNFAAESHVDRSIDNPSVFARTNIMGTLNLLNLAIKHHVKRFHQVSTDECYGSLGTAGRFTEDTPLDPSSPYSAAKTAADLLVQAYCRTYGMDVIVTRGSNTYGPWQYPEKLIPLMVYNAVKGNHLPVYGDGRNVRDWIHVEDHCRAILLAFENGTSGRTYNVGADCEQNNLFIIRAILRVLDKPESLIEFVKDRPGHDRRYAIDSTRIRQELGWRPMVDFGKGLEQTIVWYRDHADWMDGMLEKK